jgi:translation elongation factor EF-G
MGKVKTTESINNMDEIKAELQKDIIQLQQRIKDIRDRKQAHEQMFNRELQQAYKSLDRKQNLIVKLK